MHDPLLDCEGDIRDYLAEHTTTQCPPLLAQACASSGGHCVVVCSAR